LMPVYFKFLALSFGALLPLINPLASALVFLGMVGGAPRDVLRSLARKIAFTTALFLAATDLGGAGVLKLFGISLPVMQLAGGLVLAAMGWRLLNGSDTVAEREPSASVSDP